MELRHETTTFAQYMFNVLDSYNKEDEAVENKIVIETLIPSVKGNYNLIFEIEWDVDDQRWNIRNQDETQYNVKSNFLVDWFNKLLDLKLIDDYSLEYC